MFTKGFEKTAGNKTKAATLAAGAAALTGAGLYAKHLHKKHKKQEQREFSGKLEKLYADHKDIPLDISDEEHMKRYDAKFGKTAGALAHLRKNRKDYLMGAAAAGSLGTAFGANKKAKGK